MVVVTPKLPVKTVPELIAYSKANPGTLNWGYGLGTSPHLIGELFKHLTKADIASIPYKGGANAVTDILAGQIHMNVGTTATLVPLVKTGRLRAIAVIGEERYADLPDVPTMAESGVPLSFTFWTGLLAPAATPPDVLQKLNATLNEVLANPELKASMAKLGLLPKPGTPQQFNAFLEAEAREWSRGRWPDRSQDRLTKSDHDASAHHSRHLDRARTDDRRGRRAVLSRPAGEDHRAAGTGRADRPARARHRAAAAGRLGQNVIIENRGGAGGVIAAKAAGSAEPDGYTLFIGNTSVLVQIPILSQTAGYDPAKLFAPVARLAESYQVLFVHPSLPVKTMAELVAYAKANPGKLNYSSAGIGNTIHLAGELFNHSAGINIVHVPYNSGAEATTAVLGGQVQMTFVNITGLPPLIADGKLRALAVTSPKRLAALPDVPTMIESGYPDFMVRAFFGVVAPAATPARDRRQAQRHHQRRDGVDRDADHAQAAGRRGRLGHGGGFCGVHRAPSGAGGPRSPRPPISGSIDGARAAARYPSAATPACATMSSWWPAPPLTPIAPISLPSATSGSPPGAAHRSGKVRNIRWPLPSASVNILVGRR